MTITEPAVSPAAAAAAVPRRVVSEWQTAVTLGVIEGKRLAKVLAVPAALGLLMASGGRNAPYMDLRPYSYDLAFQFLLMAAVCLVASHRAVTRPRREDVEELLAPAPAPARAVTAGHLLAVVAGLAVAVVVALVGLAIVSRVPYLVGDPVWSEVAVGPVLVLGAGCLGVLLARTWPQPFVPYVACVAIALFEMNVGQDLGSGTRWLIFWVQGSLWWAAPRFSGLHLLYLLALTSMAVVGALIRHGVTRTLTVAGTIVIAVTVATAGLQMRQPAGEWRAHNAKFAAPASVQECETRRGVRYCTFHEFDDMTDYFADRVEGVRRVVPAARWPRDLAITQRVTALEVQYGSASLPHLPAAPRGRITQPDDGEIHPGLEAGWSLVQAFGLGTQVAAKAVALPVVPDPDDGSACNAAGQARAALALWLGAHGEQEPGKGLRWLTDQAEALVAEAGVDAGAAVVAIAEVDVYGGFVVSIDDLRLALRLLERDKGAVASAVASQWDVLVNPSTSREVLAAAAGVRTPPPAPVVESPFLANAGNDHARNAGEQSLNLGPPCR